MILKELQFEEHNDNQPTKWKEVYNDKEEYVEQANKGLLVIPLPLSLLTKEGNEQHDNLFYSRCTIKENVYNIIIDSESCTIMIIITLVEKFDLSTVKHPNSHNLQ